MPDIGGISSPQREAGARGRAHRILRRQLLRRPARDRRQVHFLAEEFILAHGGCVIAINDPIHRVLRVVAASARGLRLKSIRKL